MASLPVQPVPGHSALFSQERSALLMRHLATTAKHTAVTAASRLEVRAAPEKVSSGIRELDTLTGGLPRGCLTEICGPASSGRTSVLMAALAAATGREEACALVDVSDAFDPASAATAGVNFERLLWVRCGEKKNSSGRHSAARAGLGTESDRGDREQQGIEGPLEQALRVTDLLLQSGGFGMVAIDLGGIPFRNARRISLTSWFRFQRTVENTPTVLFVIAEAPCASSCAALLLKLRSRPQTSDLGPQEGSFQSSAVSHRENRLPAHAELLEQIAIEGEVLRSRGERKPVRSATTAFTTRAVQIS